MKYRTRTYYTVEQKAEMCNKKASVVTHTGLSTNRELKCSYLAGVAGV